MNQKLLELVLQSPRLPSLPTIAIDVIDLVQQKDVNIKQIASTISNDPALTGKILKTVNSSFYGQQQPISTISHALVILGLNSVKTLALGFSLVSKLKDTSGEGFDHFAYWKRSLFTAVAARALAKEVGLVQHEEAFLGGLLQDLGMLAMAQTLGANYCSLAAKVGAEHRLLVPVEREAFQTDHAELGAALAEHWKLPPLLVAPVRFHEQPDLSPAHVQALVRCVALGNRVADVFMSLSPGRALDGFYQLADTWFSLRRDRAEPLLTAITRSSQEMRHLFDLPTGSLDHSEAILARANEALLQITLQQQQKSLELEQQNRTLAAEATTDGLTGVSNRRRFNQFFADQFALVHSGTGPLSLVFMDVDHFKSVNDRYGHQVGDRVLMELGGVLKSAAPAPGLVARYGGEEFAVVLPGIDRVTAARFAESLRQRIASAPIDDEDGQVLSVTVSIGVATHQGDFFERPEQLIKCADQAVYAAKSAGRNCVRVFTPRPKPTAQRPAA